MAKFKRKSDFVLTLSLNPAKRFENVWGCLLLQGPIMIWFLWKSGLDDGLVGKERGGGGGGGRKGSDCWSWVIDHQWLWFCWGVKVDPMLGVWRYQRRNDTKMMLEEALEYSNKVVENWVWDRVIFLGFIVTVKCGTFVCRDESDDVKLLNLSLGKNSEIFNWLKKL